jgi:hypothetical protein
MTTKEVLKDKDYNLVSTLYHALQGAETSRVYMKDAKSEGDSELDDYFKDVHRQYQKLAEKAKSLLNQRIA